MINYYNNESYLNKKRSEKGINKLLFFVLWPFGAWLYALRSSNTRSSLLIFFMFSLLICWHFEPTGYNDGYDDFLGIMERFLNTDITNSMMSKSLYAYFSGDENAPKELYENLLIWFSKNIAGNNYHFFFLLAAIPIALCQITCVRRIVLDERFTANSLYGLIILALFIMPRDIITAQNPRFATGFWICTACSLAYFCDKRFRLLWAALITISPFFHSAMLVYVALFYIALIIPKKDTRWLEICAYISIPFMFFDADLFSSISNKLSFLPSAIQTWVENYMNEEMYAKYITNVGRSGFWWVLYAFNIAIRVMYVIMTLQLIKNKKEVYNNFDSKSFYPIYLMLFSAINMVQFIPVLGERYYWFIEVFCIFVWFKAFYPSRQRTAMIMLCCWTWFIVNRYMYILGGALSVNTPLDLFISPLPYLIGKGLFW